MPGSVHHSKKTLKAGLTMHITVILHRARVPSPFRCPHAATRASIMCLSKLSQLMGTMSLCVQVIAAISLLGSALAQAPPPGACAPPTRGYLTSAFLRKVTAGTASQSSSSFAFMQNIIAVPERKPMSGVEHAVHTADVPQRTVKVLRIRTLSRTTSH
jgi:hypothetical protein